MWLRRALVVGHFRCRLVFPLRTLAAGLSSRPECIGNVLVLSNDATNAFSCTFTLQDDLFGDHLHTIGSIPVRKLFWFEQKMASVINDNRRHKLSKAIKKGKCSITTVEDLSVTLLSPEAEPLGEDTPISEAFQDGSILRVGEAFYRVVRNPPTVKRFTLPKIILSGCPVFPTLQTEHCEPQDCLIEWFVRAKPSVSPPPPQANWDLVHRGPFFVFQAEDHVGHWVKVQAEPYDRDGLRKGLVQTDVATQPIMEGPTVRSPIRARHEATLEMSGPRALRIVSYNLLADFYADSDYSRRTLFPYCPPRFLDFSYRHQVILWELLGYNADILCLQEVDKAFYETVLQPVFCRTGDFEAHFLPKWNLKREGVVILYRRSKLELVRDCSLPSLTAALSDMGSSHFDSLPEDVANTKAFHWKWSERNQGLLTLVLRSVEDPQAFVCVASTHLYSFPTAANIRLLQSAVCLKHLELTKEAVLTEHDGARCGVLFAGDFNSTPTSGVFRFVTEGRFDALPCDWYSSGMDEFFGIPDLQHSLQLQSVYKPEEIVCTNFTSTYCGILDYIFFDKRELALVRNVALPTLRELYAHTALPNECFPSDHLALVSEVTWR